MKYSLKMIDLDGRVVATKVFEQENDPGDEGLKLVERAQNRTLAIVGFKGFCKVERVE